MNCRLTQNIKKPPRTSAVRGGDVSWQRDRMSAEIHIFGAGGAVCNADRFRTKKEDTHKRVFFFGDPPEIRTPDTLLKRRRQGGKPP